MKPEIKLSVRIESGKNLDALKQEKLIIQFNLAEIVKYSNSLGKVKL
jgi:hypothetical protein